MIAVDTNVLVRVLVDDPVERRQVAAARRRVRRARRVFVPQVVQAETVWVLQSAYGLEKIVIVSVLDQLANNRAYVLQNDATFRAALAAFREGGADFSDYLILADSEAAGCRLVTFDARLRKSPGVEGV
jgi:predicted nucleic-acid-binding protein